MARLLISVNTVFAPLRVTLAALVVIVPPPNESVEVAAVLVAMTLYVPPDSVLLAKFVYWPACTDSLDPPPVLPLTTA